MNRLLHNFLTDMPLPYFLAMYSGCSLIAILAGSFWIWLCDGTRDEDLADDCELLDDPYQLAFMSGHAKRVAALGIFELLELGYLEKLSSNRRLLLVHTSYLRRCRIHPPLDALTPIQSAIWNWLDRPRSMRDAFDRQAGLAKIIEPLCGEFEKPLQDLKLLETPFRSISRRLVGSTVSIGILVLGTYKLITSVIAGHPETFCLMLMMTVGLAFTAIICRSQRLSDLGQRVLDRARVNHGAGDLIPVETSDIPDTFDSQQMSLHDQLLKMALSGVPHSRNKRRSCGINDPNATVTA